VSIGIQDVDVPLAPSGVASTSLSGTNVIISWPAATEERGAAVDGYQVLFYSHTNSDW
jgi:hypothetical protein